MATVTTLRPSVTIAGSGWTPSSGTLNSVTSDDNDSTYAEWNGSGAPMILGTPVAAPPSGHQRHAVRIRSRGTLGDAWWAVRLPSGVLTGGAFASFTSTPTTVAGSWGTNVPGSLSIQLSCYVAGQSSSVRILELFLDVDSRVPPTFTPQILDGTGASTTTVTDTPTPTIRADSVILDGLPPRQYRYWITQGSDIIWDTGITSGPAIDRMVDTPLLNGSYTLHAIVWSTIRSSSEYASDEETVNFDVNVGALPAPTTPTVLPVADTPFLSVEVCAPDDLSTLDNEQVWIEIQRVDCNGENSTIAIVGPLTEEECTEWVDYTIPRAGVGVDCNHEPEECCSYYRARSIGFIDDILLTSLFSDNAFQFSLNGIILMWPDTAASIPDGWTRVTDLNGTYIKSIPDNSTNPGNTGGSSTHTHPTDGHNHSANHFHGQSAGSTGSTSTATTYQTGPNAAAGTTHTHSLPTANTSTAVGGVDTETNAPGSSSVNNELDRLAVIFLQGSLAVDSVPEDMLGIFDDIAPTGWGTYADATGRYLKGATGDGGGTSSNTLTNHTHTVNSHQHSGTSHTHTSANTGQRDGTAPDGIVNTGAVSRISNIHTHPVTINNASTNTTGSASGGTSTTATPDEPPFINVRIRQNNSGGLDIPLGIIGLWRQSLASIPQGWELCDGNNSTPDLTGRFVKGATSDILDTGGDLTGHTHVGGSHTHTMGSHNHGRSVGNATANLVSTAGAISYYHQTHTHSISSTNSTTPTASEETSGNLTSQDVNTEPVHEEVAFIQLQEIPEPPPEPPTFCLNWTSEQHLIRTLGPDGPMFAGVCGIFSWTKTRPFTAKQGVMGTQFVVSASPGERNYRLIAAVKSDEELEQLHAILSRPLVLISPSDATEVWAAPVLHTVNIVKVGRVREVTVEFIGTGPEPEPQLQDVG